MNQKSTLQLIKSRRTSYQFLDKSNDPVSLEAINICLEASIYAPNHKLTQPWLFWVVGEKTQQKLAHIYADNRALKNSQPNDEETLYQKKYQTAFDKFMAIPSVVLVGQTLSSNKVVCKEDYAACACAIQNFQLMAWSLKIGVQWSTGPVISDQRTYDLLDIKKQNTDIVGALYLGHIDQNNVGNKTPKRKAIEEVMMFL